MNTAIARNIDGSISKELKPSHKSNEHIGERLAQVRMAKKLDVKSVANKLHLSVTTIQALEQDQLDKIGSVFVRGYVKNYARLLGLGEDELPSLPKNQELPTLIRPITTPYESQHEIRSNHIIVQAITWTIALGISALFGLWWQGQIEWEENPIELPLQTLNTNPEIMPPTANKSIASTPNATTMIPQPLAIPIKPPITAELPSPLTTPQTLPVSITTPATIPVAPMTTPPSAEPGPSAPTPTIPTPAAPTTIPAGQAIAGGMELVTTTSTATNPLIEENVPLPKIVLQILKTCRVEIIDSTKQFKLSRKMRKGEEYTLAGKPPYAVTLDKPTAVKLTINGELFKIPTRKRNSKTSFDLNPTPLTP